MNCSKESSTISFTNYVRRVNILFILSNLSQAHLHVTILQYVPLFQTAKMYMWVKNVSVLCEVLPF